MIRLFSLAVGHGKNRLTAGICLLAPLLFFSACAAPPSQNTPQYKDPSRPNVASIYYYLSGSMLHYEGDYVSAGMIYQRAEEQDPFSPQIRKQILINSAYAYLNQQQSKEATLAGFNAARQTESFDEDLLSAAYSVYRQAEDYEDMEWAINESIARYPSSRAYLQKFYFDLVQSGSRDEKSLEMAAKLAKNNAEDLVLTARMYVLVDKQRALQLMLQANSLAPNPALSEQITEFFFTSGSPYSDALKQFNSFIYPQDKALMNHWMDTAVKAGALSTLLQVKDDVFATKDVSMMGSLAYAAYAEEDLDALHKLHEILSSTTPQLEEDAAIATCLLAEALFSDTFGDPQVFADMLHSAIDVNSLLSYREARYAKTIKDSTATSLPNYQAAMQGAALQRLTKSPVTDYLSAIAEGAELDSPEVSSAYLRLCKYFVEQNKGSESDWRTLLSSYHQEKNTPAALPVLRRAVNRFPNSPLFLNDLGYSLLENSNTRTEAGTYISRAVALEPENAYYQDSIAWYYYLNNDYENALKHIAIPLRMTKPPTEIAYHIAVIFIANKNIQAAMPFLQTALDDNDNPNYQEKAKTLMQGLGEAAAPVNEPK